LFVAGIDEVGRGCLAGSVIAAVVILNPQHPIPGLTDSKKLSPKKRQRLAEQIKLSALAWSIGRVEASEIDRINILQASLLAMQRAFAVLNHPVDWVKVDGNQYPAITAPGETVIQGDLTVAENSAASILAKVTRDEEMQWLEQLYPGYGFAVHKGYPTSAHLKALQTLGPCESHRLSFKPVQKLL
jgi:ribonuclease HII